MLRLDIRRPELAGFIACEKDYAPGFLRIAFKHDALPPDLPGREELCLPDLPKNRSLEQRKAIFMIMQSTALKTQALKRFYRPLITLPKKLFCALLIFLQPQG